MTNPIAAWGSRISTSGSARSPPGQCGSSRRRATRTSPSTPAPPRAVPRFINGSGPTSITRSSIFHQCLRLEPVGGQLFRIVAKHSGKVLNIKGASTRNGAELTPYDWADVPQQKWRLVRA
ncbi:RICIN domain-containing protein [Stigmatella erecta]|uniref:RICIN domain-containing protein n=1 Tax=Stigmatella erecta TaxID=83460 RepID=UPI000B811624